MTDANELMELGLAFHGHKCPAMPLGLRAALAAMQKLGVEKAQDKELKVISETGKAHAAGCFLDGVMVATGCTYGKSNIEKLYYNKMAFTLIDVKNRKSVRVSLKPPFLTKMLESPFVAQRKKGVPPQDVPAAIADPLVHKVIAMPEEMFLDIGPVQPCEVTPEKGTFDIKPCAVCGEMAFINKLVETDKGLTCLGCIEKLKA